MNQRLEGWRLVLAVLVPAALIAVALWFLLQALGSDDDNQAIDSSIAPTSTPLPTSPAQNIADLPDPTAVPSPTPLEIPSSAAVAPPSSDDDAEPDDEPTTEPEETATSEPNPAPRPDPPAPGPSTPTTPTPDPDELRITCTGPTFPVSLAPGGSITDLAAAVSPADQADDFTFLWNFGNGRLAGAPNAGTVTYDMEGRFPISVEATNRNTLEVITVVCGDVVVSTDGGGGGGGGSDALMVSCTVRPQFPELVKWEDATPADSMRITVVWTPDDAKLRLTYIFPPPLEQAVIVNDASSGDSRIHTFVSNLDVMRIEAFNPDTGERANNVSCPAFTDAPPTYNQAGNP